MSGAEGKQRRYDADVVVVGSGFAGALVAKRLATAGAKVLVLEAGTGQAETWGGYQSYLERFYTQTIKVPNSPYPPNPDAPSPNVLDTGSFRPGQVDSSGYFVQVGPRPFASDYLRATGGTSLHWLGHCYRMAPNDFRMQSLYGRAVDWPFPYEHLEPYYSKVEYELGVSADAAEQSYEGIEGLPFKIPFKPGYQYPMETLPQSWFDQQLAPRLDGMRFRLGDQDFPVALVPVPQAKNSRPRWLEKQQRFYRPVPAVGRSDMGQRCEGNSACIPICPVQAKYNSLKTIMTARQELVGQGKDPDRWLEVRNRCVASRVLVDRGTGRITGVEYKRYETPGSPASSVETVTARAYVLAAHTVENAKILLASEAANSSGQVGRNLMDHPYLILSGLFPENIGAFRGPCMTSGIPTLRDGAFRREHAAFLVDVVNWGWNYPGGAPFQDVVNAVDSSYLFGGALRARLESTIPRQFTFGFLVEQVPQTTNRVTIDPAYRDALGNFRPVIHYDVGDYTRAAFVEATRFTEQLFQRVGAENCTVVDPTSSTTVTYDGMTFNYHAAGHLVGTTRTGAAARDSVVDPRQRTWDHPNLYLAGCGNMPTIGTSNPTETAAALAWLAADSVLEDLAR